VTKGGRRVKQDDAVACGQERALVGPVRDPVEVPLDPPDVVPALVDRWTQQRRGDRRIVRILAWSFAIHRHEARLYRQAFESLNPLVVTRASSWVMLRRNEPSVTTRSFIRRAVARSPARARGSVFDRYSMLGGAGARLTIASPQNLYGGRVNLYAASTLSGGDWSAYEKALEGSDDATVDHARTRGRSARSAGAFRQDLDPAMTDAACKPLSTLAPLAEREQRPDRFAELLECMADLLVETRKQGLEIAENRGSDDPREREAIARLTELERSVEGVGLEAASVHQLLQPVHLV
jgi:hypothetical protein